MSLSTTLVKPVIMVSGSIAEAGDVNTNFDYVVNNQNTTNTQVNTLNDEVVAGRQGQASLDARADASEARITAVEGEIEDARGTEETLDDRLAADFTADRNRLSALESGKADITGETYSGTHDFSGADAVLIPATAPGGSGNQAATKDFVTNAALSANIPNQAGNAWKFLSTNGSIAGWQVGGYLAMLRQTSPTFAYNSDGTMDTATYTGGYKAKYNYTSGNLSSVQYYDADGTTLLFTQSLTYDGNGVLTAAPWS